jgi:starvation-inducible DNA-binding protein
MDTLIQQMRVILGTNFGLYFKSHSFHWNVEGPNFSDYHAFLGTFYTEVFANTDLIAEKIRMLGAYAPIGLSRMLELSDIEESGTHGMFVQLTADNERLIHHLRAGIQAADNAEEPAISNFLQDLLDQHQKKNWMLKSITK